jgi:hypothetical protein
VFTIAQYADKLAIVMRKILLISQVAGLGRDFEEYVVSGGNEMEAPHVDGLDKMDGLLDQTAEDSCRSLGGRSSIRQKRIDSAHERAALDENARVIDPYDRNPLTGFLNSTQKRRIMQLLGAWEEPLVGSNLEVRIPAMFHYSWHSMTRRFFSSLTSVSIASFRWIGLGIR